ncbi:putative phage abortive infection protein [Photobacterium toruni]|uniref:Phage abortive infection protein n=1 Tax=Photobacterium toruni TaxID=1935446 RepID=A0A1T4PVM7_9GAMM|nr:putative phage abortive infection protein [Photobacterium toruni]SJZ94978.1 hypothetical protein CZ814_00872 [Photobacterium toruni]
MDNSQNNELIKLKKTIKRTKQVAISAVIIIPTTYAIALGLIGNQSISLDSSSWGTFGDFMGGILNPVIALLAFYWLVESVLIQKTELSATQKILQETEQTQKKQQFENSFFSLLEQMNTVFTQLNTRLPEPKNVNSYKSVMDTFTDTVFVSFSSFDTRHISATEKRYELFIKNKSDTNHYFRIIYQILKFILNNNADSKDNNNFDILIKTDVNKTEKFYSNIIRSFLNKDVTNLLAINCLDTTKFSNGRYEDYSNFRKLIERYSMLEHISMLPNLYEIITYYDRSAFGDNKVILDYYKRKEKS